MNRVIVWVARVGAILLATAGTAAAAAAGADAPDGWAWLGPALDRYGLPLVLLGLAGWVIYKQDQRNFALASSSKDLAVKSAEGDKDIAFGLVELRATISELKTKVDGVYSRLDALAGKIDGLSTVIQTSLPEVRAALATVSSEIREAARGRRDP